MRGSQRREGISFSIGRRWPGVAALDVGQHAFREDFDSAKGSGVYSGAACLLGSLYSWMGLGMVEVCRIEHRHRDSLALGQTERLYDRPWDSVSSN